MIACSYGVGDTVAVGFAFVLAAERRERARAGQLGRGLRQLIL